MLAFVVSLMMASPDLSVLTIPIEPIDIKITQQVWTKDSVREYALQVATEYGLHKQRFLDTIECENHFNATGQSEHWYQGKREESYGAVQINLPSHPTVTRAQAEDPTFAIPWMAQKWLDGDAAIWSCYRLVRDWPYPSSP